MFSTDADLFFEPVTTCPKSPGRFGVLHALRRDISLCLGIDPNTGCKIPHETLWLGAMGILAGVDLLAKFYAGDDSGKVVDRFEGFVKKFFQPISDDDATVLYQLRNSLLHSFGLYSKTSKGKEYRFILGREKAQFISHSKSDFYIVDIGALHKRFASAVDQYRCALAGDLELQRRFAKLFPNYGACGTWPAQ